MPRARVTEAESGISEGHIDRIAAVAKDSDCFIFIRRSELDTAKLIGLGLATKSVDVHSKSSNWGPMAGMVPVDPVFSKKGDGVLNPSAPLPVGDPHHPAAVPAQLVIPRNVFDGFTRAKLRPADAPANFVAPAGGANPLAQPRIFFTALSGVGPGADRVFRLDEERGGYRVWWIADDGASVELHVWHYVVQGAGLRPVTGDYDLWMIAPHAATGLRGGHVTIGEYTCRRPDGTFQGATQTTHFIQTLIATLNRACDREDNPVFNHGAEAQNLLFTQPIDKSVAMFTPSGASRVVTEDELPRILAACQSRGYLVYTNRMYKESNPSISGKSPAQFMADQRAERARVERLSEGCSDVLERLIRSQAEQGARRAQEEREMVDFGVRLRRELMAIKGSLVGLAPEDLPKARRAPLPVGSGEIVRLLNQLVTDSVTGRGVSTEALGRWLTLSQSYFVTLAASLGFALSSAHFDGAMRALQARAQRESFPAQPGSFFPTMAIRSSAPGGGQAAAASARGGARQSDPPGFLPQIIGHGVTPAASPRTARAANPRSGGKPPGQF